MHPALDLPLWTVLPFAGLLLSIALLPLALPRFWEPNRNKAVVAALFGLPIAAYLLIAQGSAGAQELLEKAREYVSFLLLLAALFVITGGIFVRGSSAGTPLVNTGLIGLGALLASAIGTTGASVLLIRPLLRANASRQDSAHIVIFFIFSVSNCGGLLTPLGDPPLFLGFLKGVPFGWTLQLWREWLSVNGALLLLFALWDQRVLAREKLRREGSRLEAPLRHEPFGVEGRRNFGFLALVVLVMLGAGAGFGNGGSAWPFGVQEGLLLLLAAAAFASTPGRVRAANRFSFRPIVGVAVLFAGIFATMAPALILLNQNAASFGIREPWHFFWATGLLSAFLDNAPTYLSFAAAACGLEAIPLEGPYLGALLARGETQARILAAISCGAVFMGAISYVGNGPNFMVKAIAEENGVRMPSFFGYLAWSCGLLLPLFAGVTFLYYR